MSLFEKIKQENINSLKSGDKLKRQVYTLLIGEVTRKGDPGDKIDDADVISAAKKIVSGINEMLESGADQNSNLAERALLLELIPKEAGADEIKSFVDEYADANSPLTMKDMGTVMAAVKSHFNGAADGKVTSSIVRARLSA